MVASATMVPSVVVLVLFLTTTVLPVSAIPEIILPVVSKAAVGCTGAVLSGADARRLIEQGAVSLEDQMISDPSLKIVPKPQTILRVGKKRFFKLIVKNLS